MKRVAALLFVLAMGIFSASAQETPDAAGLARIGLKEDQIDRVLEIQAQTENETRLARAELDLLRARLTRELIEAEPDRELIKSILREAVEWEYKLRLARVEAELDIRQVVGDQTWGRMVEARERAERARRPTPNRN